MAKYRECSGEILRRLADGESLRAICGEGDMPSVSTVYRWLMPGGRGYRAELAERYGIARRLFAESLVERLLEVAQDSSISDAKRKAEIDALKTAISLLRAARAGRESGVVTVRVVYVDEDK